MDGGQPVMKVTSFGLPQSSDGDASHRQHSRLSHREGRPLSIRPFDGQVAAHQADEATADGYSQARPPYWLLADASACENASNGWGKLRLGHPDLGVADGESDDGRRVASVGCRVSGRARGDDTPDT